MNRQVSGSSLIGRAWAFLLGTLVFVLIAQMLVKLVVPLLPWVVVGAVGFVGWTWWRSRW